MYQKTRIIIVDDNIALAKSMKEYFELSGFESHTANNPIECLKLSREINFDLAVIDINLPGMNGYQLFKEMRQIDPDIECIIITGGPTFENAIEAARNRGVISYEIKPFDMIRFEKLIRDILVRKRIEEELKQSEERFSKAFHNNPSAQSISEFETGLILDINEAYLALTGYKKEEVIGFSSLELGLWNEPDVHSSIIEELKANRIIKNQEVDFKTKSGNILHLTWSAVVINLLGIDCLLTTAIDKTNNRRAQARKDIVNSISSLFQSSVDFSSKKMKTGIIYGIAAILTEKLKYPAALVEVWDSDNNEMISQVIVKEDVISEGILVDSIHKYFSSSDTMKTRPFLTNVSGGKSESEHKILKDANIKTLINVPISRSIGLAESISIAHNLSRPNDEYLKDILKAIADHIAVEFNRLDYESGLRNLAREIISAQEDERTELSKELHDDICQQLAANVMEFEWLIEKPGGKKQLMLELLSKMKMTVSHLRQICKALRPPLLDDMGIDVAIKNLLEEYIKRYDLKIEFIAGNEDWYNMNDKKTVAIFRVLQEYLNNVIKHVEVKNIEVRLERNNFETILTVSDDEKGLDTGILSKNATGIRGIQERVFMNNGSLEMTCSERGCKTVLKIPDDGAF